jgi:hypothetical protein
MLHFAPRYGIVSPCLTCTGGLPARTPVNDNGARTCANDDSAAYEAALLEAALRMFAAHGLSAAVRACEAAEIAKASSDYEGADWWLAVCATFDSAMARACLARQFVRA